LNNKVIINPDPFFLLNSLRSVGYSLAHAVADIIDNSISAHASKINIQFEYDKAIRIYFLDNGHGMNSEELLEAMNISSKDCEKERSSTDLGRFGIGLKIASFSQCKHLTVVSKKEKENISSYRWDLDLLKKQNQDGFFILSGYENEDKYLIDLLDSYNSGTLVIWNKIDRLEDDTLTPDKYTSIIDDVICNLRLTFHRFLEQGISISVNNEELKPWSPFFQSPNTYEFPFEELDDSVSVKCYILPSRRKISDEVALENQGIEGWEMQQGFYLYRNDRLIVPGSWLNLSYNGKRLVKKVEYQLVRIELNIRNNVDFEWNIDVKKAAAKVPNKYRSRLGLIAYQARKKGKEIYNGVNSSRKIRINLKRENLWEYKNCEYSINRNFPLVTDLMHNLCPTDKKLFNEIIKLIEDKLPVRMISTNTLEEDEEEEDEEDI